MIIFYDLRITFPSIEEAYRGGSIQPPSSDIRIPKSSQLATSTSHITLLKNVFIVYFLGVHSELS